MSMNRMPFPGSTFKVTANEVTLGPGLLTVLENSLLFEVKDRRHLGFDLNTLRLVRLRNVNSFDVAYSIQGSLQKASFVTLPKYIRKNEGVEKDVTTNPFEWELTFWKLHTITGAVVARILADKSGIRADGITPLTDVEFDRQSGLAVDIINKLPSQQEIESGMNKKSVESRVVELNEIVLKLSDEWLMGSLSPEQRVKVAALHYRNLAKRYELGWRSTEQVAENLRMTTQDYKETAEDWAAEESLWGSDLKSIA